MVEKETKIVEFDYEDVKKRVRNEFIFRFERDVNKIVYLSTGVFLIFMLLIFLFNNKPFADTGKLMLVTGYSTIMVILLIFKIFYGKKKVEV